MSAATYVIEAHRLASDARQFGLWCFRIDADNCRSVVAYAMPKPGIGARAWHVYQARSEIGVMLSRVEAETMLHELGAAALGQQTSLAATEIPGGAR